MTSLAEIFNMSFILHCTKTNKMREKKSNGDTDVTIRLCIPLIHQLYAQMVMPNAKLSGFQMVGLLDFRSHSKSGPFATQLLNDHLKSRLVRISDPHCSPILQSRSLLKLRFVICRFSAQPGCQQPQGLEVGTNSEKD